MRTTKASLIITIILIISFIFYGCKPTDTSQFEQRIAELEEKLAQVEGEKVAVEKPAEGEEAAPEEKQEIPPPRVRP